MKQIYLLALLFIFSISAYAQEEASPQKEAPSQYDEKTGFVTVNLGGEITPVDGLKYYSTIIGLKAGGLIAQRQSFNAGLKLFTSQIADSFLYFNYAYSFTGGRQWIPGMDISLLIGLNTVKEKTEERSSRLFKEEKDYLYEYSYYPTIGLELGPYLKTFISNSFALLLRTGVTHSINTNDVEDFDIRELRVYLNLGVQWYF